MSNSTIDHPVGMSRFKAFWDFVFLSGGESIGKIAGFLAFAYLARTLDSSSYGAVELAAAMLAIFGLITDFGFGQIGAREIAQNPGSAQHWARLIPAARLILVLICIPLMCLLAVSMDLPERDTTLIWIVSLALLATAWNQVWLLQGLEKMGLISFNQALRMIVFAVGVFLFVKSDDDLLNVGAVELVAAFSMAAFLLMLQRREGIDLKMSFDLKAIKQLARRSSSIGAAHVVWALNQYVAILMVAYLAGAVAGAWFAAAHRIVNALTSYSLVYHFNLFPATASRLRKSEADYHELANSSTRVAAWFGVGAAVVGSALATPLCVLVYGDKFDAAALPLAVLIWSLPLTIMSGHARFALVASEKQKYVLAAQSGGAVTTLLAGTILIPLVGPVGASISMVASHAVVWTIVHHLMASKVSRIPGLRAILLPACTAAAVLGISYWYDFSVAAGIGSILLYAILGPLIDRKLIPAIKCLSAIKSQETE